VFRVQGLGFRVWGSGFREALGRVCGSGRVSGGFGVEGGFREGLGRVCGSSRVWGRCRV